jgi:hypothetical protein
MPSVADERNHLHCSEMCEHPQPFCVGELILCGLCFYFRDRITPMVECSRDYCGEPAGRDDA